MHNPSVVGEGRVIAKGVVNTNASELFVSRYGILKAVLVYLVDRYPEIQVLGVESPTYGESWSEGAYALFVSINEAIYLCRKDVVYFDPQTLKMLAKLDPTIRKGSMDKSDMIEAARADTGIKQWDHNEADALVIARSTSRFWEFEREILTIEDLTPSERRSFHRVHTFTKGKKAGRTERRGLVFREDDRFHKFSQVPPDPEDEEQRQWLCRKGSRKMVLVGEKKPKQKQRSL